MSRHLKLVDLSISVLIVAQKIENMVATQYLFITYFNCRNVNKPIVKIRLQIDTNHLIR